MRILQLSSARHFGGGERHVVDLANALAQRGHDVFVALIPESPLLGELSSVRKDQIFSIPLRNALDLNSARKLRKLVRDNHIEIVHAHVARDYTLAAFAASRSHGVKLVLTRHVMFPMSGAHKLTRRRVSRVIAVSAAVAANLKAQNIFDERQIVTIPHGINLDQFPGANRQSSRAEGLLRVGILGELSPVKGQVDFVQAAAIIASRREDVEFVIAGRDHSAGGENLREIERLISDSNLTNRVSVFGSIENLSEFYSTLDVFVSASRSEAFGLAIVEAMASEVAVIATATDGAREIIEDDQTGRLVPIGNVADMANAVNELLDDERKRKSLGANGRSLVTEKFSLARMVDETEQVYREVLSEADSF